MWDQYTRTSKKPSELECKQNFQKKKKILELGFRSWRGERRGESQSGDLTAPHNAPGSELGDRFNSRDENSFLGADNICFILKVAKESPGWANIVPAQDFTESLERAGSTAGMKAL